MSETQTTESIQQRLHRKYPILKKHGIKVGVGSKKGPNDRRQIEFYPPDERDNPNPGSPYIEVYNEDLSDDVIFSDSLHYLHRVDPKMREHREWLKSNMTDKQKQMSRKRYEHYTNPTSEHYNPDNPETRPYEQWFETSDFDQLLGGYSTGIWPKGGYTPEQRENLDNMWRYARSGGPPATPQNTPAPAPQQNTPSVRELGAGIQDRFSSARKQVREFIGTRTGDYGIDFEEQHK
jgi:hypothetical protein